MGRKILESKRMARLRRLDVKQLPGVDIVGDIKNWRGLGLEPETFDAIIAFEVVEHVECFSECLSLLKPGGVLCATSPVPHMDWFMELLERCGLNQKRTSKHDHLCYFGEVEGFENKQICVKAGLSQWGIFSKGQSEKRSPLPHVDKTFAPWPLTSPQPVCESLELARVSIPECEATCTTSRV